jgi:cytochrome c556
MAVRKVWRAAALGVAIMGAGGAGMALAQAQDPAQVVRERREGLRAVGAHLEAMQAIAQTRGDTRAAVPRIEAIEQWFQNFTARFPAGTGQGAPGIETRALPAIWQDFAAFQAADRALPPLLASLKEAAQSGDVGRFATALQATGGNGCGNCHRPFRAR